MQKMSNTFFVLKKKSLYCKIVFKQYSIMLKCMSSSSEVTINKVILRTLLLTHLCQMDLPSSINLISLYISFKGCWVLFFIYIQNLIYISVASDLGLRCLLCPTKRTLGIYGLKVLITVITNFWCTLLLIIE